MTMQKESSSLFRSAAVIEAIAELENAYFETIVYDLYALAELWDSYAGDENNIRFYLLNNFADSLFRGCLRTSVNAGEHVNGG